MIDTYANNLSSSQRDLLHVTLTARINAENEKAYMDRMALAKSNKEKNACSGRYEGPHWRLRTAWENGDVSTKDLHVALQIDGAYDDELGVIFSPCGTLNKTHKKSNKKSH